MKTRVRSMVVAGLASLSVTAALGCSIGAPPPPGPKVPVAFRAPEGAGPHKLSIVGTGRTEQTCDLPCTMEVPSGNAIFVGSGARTWTISADIPKEPSEAEIKLNRRRAQSVAGWIIALVGGTAGSTAIALTRSGSADTQLKGAIAGGALAGAGLVGLIVALTAGSNEVKFTTGKVPAKLAGDTPPAPPAASGVCKSRFDCTGGKVCSLGMCVTPACVADGDCPKGQGCSLEGKCEAPGSPTSPPAAPPQPAACKSHIDCKGGLVCPKGECVKPACVADKDCPSGQGCSLEGQCEPAR